MDVTEIVLFIILVIPLLRLSFANRGYTWLHQHRLYGINNLDPTDYMQLAKRG